MNKKIIFVVISGLFIIVGVLAYKPHVSKTTPQNTEQNTDNSKAVEKSEISQNPTCKISDAVEYKYYKSVTDENFWPNNKFGLYIYGEVGDYFEIAQNLVNSNGGDWGYVLIPFNVKDRDEDKWNKVFTKLTEKRLIPIIQLHDIDLDKYQKQTEQSAEFLDQFLWPIKNRYISVYNEPNSKAFWYGKIDPAQYARVLDYTIDTYKKANSNYFMINGGFNVSASTDNANMDSFEFMRRMQNEIPDIFDKLDGWASHSYPQPNFSGSPYDYGRYSIRAYENELNYLKSTLNVKKSLPVFITETGWAHTEGESYNSSYLSVETTSQYFKTAYETVWLKDDRVRAVTPFTVWYKPPNDHFAWVTQNLVPYKQYDTVKGIKKIAGQPPVLLNGVINQICQQ